MTVLFGSVEYFEREILSYLEKNGEEIKEASISEAYSTLEHELMYDFVCDEFLRKACLQNLSYACEKIAS
ncbi:hypothetical protein [Peribacillus sp. SCS-155]|uniref:hypothetical protein n=1 Tax=Peribacillus sedimenti TaxID=3115297 RepID=UPI0039067EC1